MNFKLCLQFQQIAEPFTVFLLMSKEMRGGSCDCTCDGFMFVAAIWIAHISRYEVTEKLYFASDRTIVTLSGLYDALH